MSPLKNKKTPPQPSITQKLNQNLMILNRWIVKNYMTSSLLITKTYTLNDNLASFLHVFNEIFRLPFRASLYYTGLRIFDWNDVYQEVEPRV